MYMEIKDLVKFLLKKKNRLKGCSVSEVNRLESYFNISLPLVYKDFLYAMGKDAGKFMLGSSAFYSVLFKLRQDCEEMLLDNGLTLPDNAFVFWTHQGYQFAFFKVDEGDNPPIYFYYEGRSDIEEKEASLTDFLAAQLLMSGFEWDLV